MNQHSSATKNSNMIVLHVVAYVTAKTTLLGYNDSFAFFTQMKIKFSYLIPIYIGCTNSPQNRFYGCYF
jgi:hypothetical protein